MNFLKTAKDRIKSYDISSMFRSLLLKDEATHRTRWTIHRLQDEDGKMDAMMKAGVSLETIISLFPHRLISISSFKAPSWVKGNLCLNTGIQGFEKLLGGLSSPPTAWNNANAYIGVGDSSTAAAATQTDLQAASNRAYVGMQASYPSQSGQTMSWQASFGSAVANYAWNEMVISNASTYGSGVCLNRIVSAQGTKTSGQTWVITVQITWS